MGYCMQLIECDFVISHENKKKALMAIKNLVGSESIHDASGAHFSWVTTSDFLNAETLEDALDVWRWEADTDEEGNIVDISFIGEKLGDDETLFKSIARFVNPGCYIQMEGEDGTLWRWVFDGANCKEVVAKVSWPE